MTDEDQQLPILAPCKKIELLAPLRWLRLGWQDCKKAPKQTAMYGGAVVIISYLIFSIAWHYNSITLAIALLSTFIFIAPILCIGLYSIARQLKRQQTVGFRESVLHGIRPYGDLLIFVIIIMVISLVWVRAASMIHIFMPINTNATIVDLVMFLGVGSVVGSIFATLIFCVSVFSLPMIMDKETDMITACISSFNAVLRNKASMAFWSLIVVIFTGIGFLSAFFGFVIIVPLLGYATWHGYRESLEVDAWDDRITEFSDSIDNNG